MRIEEIMKRIVTTIGPDDTIGRARTIMESEGIRHLVVMDGKSVLGVLSDRDTRCVEIPGRSTTEREWTDAQPVAAVMSEPALTVGTDESVQDAANRMRGNKIGCLPVVKEGRLVGVVTETDLLEALTRTATSSRQRPSVRARGNKNNGRWGRK